MTTVEMLLVEKKRGGFGIGNQESLLKDSRSFMMKKLLKNNGVVHMLIFSRFTTFRLPFRNSVIAGSGSQILA